MPTQAQRYRRRARNARRSRRLSCAFLGATEPNKLLDGTVPRDGYRYVTVDWFQPTATLASIRRMHPHSAILAYQNFAGMRVGPHATVDGQSRPTSLVTFEEANAHGEDWFLHKETDNSRITFCDFTDLYAANLSSSSWRTQATSRFAAIKAAGYDGMMLDDVNLAAFHCLGEGESNDSVEFASTNAYRDATVAAMGVVKPAADAQRLLVTANVGADPWNADARVGFTNLLPTLHAWNRESYHSWAAPISDIPWTGSPFFDLQGMVAEAEAAGIASMLESNPLNPVDDTRMLRFGQAAWYLEYLGRTPSAYAYNNGEPIGVQGQYRWLTGSPVEAKQRVSGTVDSDAAWMRRWTDGYALVNAKTAAGLVTFGLVGGPYLDPSGASVTSVQLDRGHGMVLRKP